MSTELTTPNNSFRYPTSANDGNDFASGIGDLADDVDGMWQQNTISNRPAASSVKARTVFYATDTTTYYLSNGSTWSTMLVAGAWVALTLVHGTHPSGYVPSARLEGDLVRLKGVVAVSTTSGFATLPSSGLYPSTTINQISVANSGGWDFLTISSGGSLTCGSVGDVELDGVTYSIS